MPTMPLAFFKTRLRLREWVTPPAERGIKRSFLQRGARGAAREKSQAAWLRRRRAGAFLDDAKSVVCCSGASRLGRLLGWILPPFKLGLFGQRPIVRDLVGPCAADPHER